LAPALIGHDGEQPGPEVRTAAEPAEMAPSLEHRLLHCVLGIGLGSEHTDRQAVCGREERLHQDQKSLLVTAQGFMN
jgi:hypothetical protein